MAHFPRANLWGADMSGADLRWTNLRGNNLNGTNLSKARYNAETTLPFDDEEAARRGMIKED